ncbi:4097_t:CDS:2 [Entrophospora sp. SA101]|nr:10132_t:CDS:2 [Entrophospora sp. SA101]CAJ0765674.1 4097_t:CDS:2 [Entrophospora sp. SA101]CAJ0915403.1 5505_t:CDS:2 [Entrophospora sp. SA101]CAJ0920840.1 22510_t:CDS:2 [Entrophospora sp. SA101]
MQDIIKESEIVDKKSQLQWKEGLIEFEKTGLHHLKETSYSLQQKLILSYTSNKPSYTSTHRSSDDIVYICKQNEDLIQDC